MHQKAQGKHALLLGSLWQTSKPLLGRHQKSHEPHHCLRGQKIELVAAPKKAVLGGSPSAGSISSYAPRNSNIVRMWLATPGRELRCSRSFSRVKATVACCVLALCSLSLSILTDVAFEEEEALEVLLGAMVQLGSDLDEHTIFPLKYW